MGPTPLSVGDVTLYLQELLSGDDNLADLWIEGEVTEVFTSSAGHVYFSLRDEHAKLKCVLFRSVALRDRYRPVAGQSCAVHGHIAVYPREGQYQLYADFVRPAGIGLAALEFELLKQRLTAEGLFDESRKRPLPERIRTVGLVTSAEGAVRHDIATVMQRRNPLLTLVLAPAAVQGDRAPASLRMALATLITEGQCDVIIIGRGGGSATDLAAFNDEDLVREVFASPVPIISAVGHETDWTLLDLVADLRAPTPSAAAEIVSAEVSSSVRQLYAALGRHASGFLREISVQMLEVSHFREELTRTGPATLLPSLRSSLDEHTTALGLLTRSAIERGDILLTERTDDLHHYTSDRTAKIRRELEANRALLSVLDPTATLARGYAVLTEYQSGLPVRSAGDVQPGELLRARLQDGSFVTRVEEKG